VTEDDSNDEKSGTEVGNCVKTLKISKFTYKNIHTFFIVSRITHYVSHNGNVNPVVK